MQREREKEKAYISQKRIAGDDLQTVDTKVAEFH